MELYNWNNDLLWSYNISSDSEIQNHDVYPLSNGNILVVIWEAISSDSAIAAGRNPALLLSTLYSAKIEEIQPVGTNQANIVWQWRLWDHLIQDFDSTKSHYGIVAAHPELVDLNYVGSNVATKDWIHPNAIAYNPNLDQIILSAHNLSEVWILDHSTTTVQATGHSGGAHNKGGDLLYRWGNPQVYRRGTAANEMFYTQHTAYWIPEGYPYAGSVMVFNNGVARPGGNASSVDIFTTPVDSNGNYPITSGQAYGPNALAWTYPANPDTGFYSNVMGSGEMLPNGNVVICAATTGNFFEIDTNKNVVWRYVNPVNDDTILPQGAVANNNALFRCTQYGPSFSGFIGDSLIPIKHIEKNPVFTACDSTDLNTGITIAGAYMDCRIFPNPAFGKVTVVLNAPTDETDYQLINMLGDIVASGRLLSSKSDIELPELMPGLYVLKLSSGNRSIRKKIVIER